MIKYIKENIPNLSENSVLYEILVKDKQITLCSKRK